MAEYITTDAELKTVADAIRGKTGGSANLAYPNGFASAIQGIGSFGTDGASASDIKSGKKAYVGNSAVTGTMPVVGATNWEALGTDRQIIGANQCTSGAQVIKAVTAENLSKANIKKGVTISVKSGSTTITSLTGTCQECRLPASGMVPMILGVNTSWTGWSLHSESSSYESQSTSGYIYRADMYPSDNKSFVVPARMTWTIFDGGSKHNTKTVTLEPNTWYWFRGTNSSGSRTLAIYTDSSGTNKLTDFYKLVSWAYA